MATIREGNQSVLLIVDVQVGVLRPAWEAPRTVRNIARAVERARAAGVPVIWVQHEDHELPQGSPEWQWVPELVRGPSELLVPKRFNSAFEQTPLEDELDRLGATHIVLAGASTNFCIRATAYAALDRGYDLTLLADAHTTDTLVLEDGERISAATIVRDLNTTMAWLSYPGRENAVATAESIDFAAPGDGRSA